MLRGCGTDYNLKNCFAHITIIKTLLYFMIENLNIFNNFLYTFLNMDSITPYLTNLFNKLQTKM